MSGGVDSSVVAGLLVEQGYDVIGITMRLGHHDSIEPDADKPSCCGVEGIMDARRVAARLKIPYYPVNYEEQFGEKVVDYFTSEYLLGRTPNPCVMCNQELKFGKLMQLADELDADYVATGHFARVDKPNGRYRLHRGTDASKDQSYVLFSLSQGQLAKTLLPLGDMTKTEVRSLAHRYGLLNADKPESQEICFIPDDNYKRFLKERVDDSIQPGKIVTKDGDELGEHGGTPFYTVGQRKGLGIAHHEPLYVLETFPKTNTVVVGSADDLLRTECVVERINWLSIAEPDDAIRATIKIRYKDHGGSATITALPDNCARVVFDEPRRAITPGQAAVFYDGDLVLGGGWIV